MYIVWKKKTKPVAGERMEKKPERSCREQKFVGLPKVLFFPEIFALATRKITYFARAPVEASRRSIERGSDDEGGDAESPWGSSLEPVRRSRARHSRRQYRSTVCRVQSSRIRTSPKTLSSVLHAFLFYACQTITAFIYNTVIT